MAWYLTWQDPVAVGLALGGLGLALWLRSRLRDRGATGCAHCPKNEAARPGQKIIPARRLLRRR